MPARTLTLTQTVLTPLLFVGITLRCLVLFFPFGSSDLFGFNVATIAIVGLAVPYGSAPENQRH